MVFFLGREVPREQLLVVIRSFGGMVGWTGEESPILDTDERITHQVRAWAACAFEEAQSSWTPVRPSVDGLCRWWTGQM